MRPWNEISRTFFVAVFGFESRVNKRLFCPMFFGVSLEFVLVNVCVYNITSTLLNPHLHIFAIICTQGGTKVT
jgi:hypothetical protein